MEIDLLTDKFVAIWTEAGTNEPNWGKRIALAEKREREVCVESFFQAMKKLNQETLTLYTDSGVLDGFVLLQLRQLFQNAFSYHHDEIDLMFSTDMMRSTKAFIKQARRFDPTLSLESVFQACRNVWIMNGLQLILGYPVKLTPSIFAYSMLYPYTDNFVDDPQVPTIVKIEFSQRFAERLEGKKVSAENDHERKIYHMVKLIEDEFDRSKYPEVFQSLLEIHRAQTESIQLFYQNEISQEEALRICIDKGGTSVLADGYLIAGRLSEQEKEFLFGYGAYLQLLDDVQDVNEDLNSGVMTTFSLIAKEQLLDETVHKTYNFGERILADYMGLLSQVELDFKGLLQKSILLFFVESVAVNNHFYSQQFRNRLEEVSPLSFHFVRLKRNFFTPKKYLLLEKLEKLTARYSMLADKEEVPN